ncbi:hypothetical protein KTO58_27415 [Chitinophaga pendula]|uniref:hypothetical protein n=1 Tax=Chitinophaga TaxID=79328 RepID=UPI000BAF0B10|nr:MULTISPECIES: hypothetical protein [Chitinophaga]ASZ09712.1 hypothetical protein CK934_01340 [Chitinophaga sp. MD30]UCJ07346.1 hypothetical protein KTO58_27415 [Chitinophaga pendula]
MITTLRHHFHPIVVIPFFALLLALFACKKEMPVTPAPGPATFYPMPQGNAPYDEIIFNWYKRYGSYILYKYEERDYRYGLTGYYTYVARPIEPEMLPAAVDLLGEYWFGFYSDSFLKKYLPFKILLADRAWDEDSEDTVYNAFEVPIRGHDFLLLPKLDRSILKMTPAERNTFKIDLNMAFAYWLIFSTNGEFMKDLPVDFFNSSPYHRTDITSANKYDYGFLLSPGFQQAPTPQYDLLSYLTLIFTYRKADIETIFFNRQTDKNGLVRKKYMLLATYFKDKYGMNIQAIGDKRN